MLISTRLVMWNVYIYNRLHADLQDTSKRTQLQAAVAIRTSVRCPLTIAIDVELVAKGCR